MNPKHTYLHMKQLLLIKKPFRSVPMKVQLYLLSPQTSLIFTEIQRLMGCFAFMRVGLENSPYADLLDPVNWLEINDILAKDACSLLGLSISSPLEVRYGKH